MAKQPTRFRVTQELVDGAIKGKPTYTRLPSGKTIICELTLQNGFTVRGESSVVDPRNFVLKIGKEIALRNAKEKIWEILAYTVQSELHFHEGVKAAAKKAVSKRAVKPLTVPKTAVRRRKPAAE